MHNLFRNDVYRQIAGLVSIRDNELFLAGHGRVEARHHIFIDGDDRGSAVGISNEKLQVFCAEFFTGNIFCLMVDGFHLQRIDGRGDYVYDQILGNVSVPDSEYLLSEFVRIESGNHRRIDGNGLRFAVFVG